MLTIKKKIYLLSTLIIFITSAGLVSMHFYDYWKLLLGQEYKETESMTSFLDKQLEGGFEDLLPASRVVLTKEEKIQLLNQKLQPIVEQMSESFPNHGIGFYSSQLNSIVAYGPNFSSDGLVDLLPSSKARIVLQTKKNYQFKDYSQTRNADAFGTIHPIVRNGEVIGLVWAHMAKVDVFAIFIEQMKYRILLLLGILLFAFLGARYIANHYEKSLETIRKKVRNLELTEKEKKVFLPEFMMVYQEVLEAKQTVIDNERKLQRDITEKIIRAQEQERTRISRELHDGVSQSLYGILVTIKLIKDSKDQQQRKEQIETIQQLTTSSMEEIKRIALDLRPSSLDDLGLIPSIRSFIDRYKKTFNMKVELDVKNKVVALPTELKTTLYRICQESLTNIMKYAETDQVYITIEFHSEEVCMEISDKGRGFERLTNTNSAGLGLIGMEERAKLHGGTLEVHSKLGEGTTVLVKIPIEKALVVLQKE